MSHITLNAAVEIVPAAPAVTTTQVTVLHIQENYGWTFDPSQPNVGNIGPGRPLTVEAVVLLDAERNIVRNIMVWEGDEYLAVRGTWTDETLAARLTEILSG